MCCFVFILAFLGPRLAFLYAWIFTSRVTEAFAGGFWLPLLGVLLLPWTALGYVLAWSPAGGVTGVGWAVVVLGLLFDLSSYGSRAAQGRYNSSN
ncbi:MAG: hypothetical protein F2840_00560 [Actinobacteria bacterium]|jgi:hypothetical protein|uniref:Unannotated protein n=1 Tax=freshwater metagenome TaxID=449393 RepID=A0A6J7IE06_9ZZZZ|nr:hypothetical protein [Actinomycetota bacterium]